MKSFSLTTILIGLLSIVTNAVDADVKIVAPVLSGHFDTKGYGRSEGVLRAIYEHCDTDVEFVTKRWGQHWQAFEADKAFDAVAVVWDSAGVSGFPSDDYIHSRNGVAFLARNGFEINRVEDLAGLRVLGFGGATNLFPSLAKVLPTLGSYWEAPPGFASRSALVNGDVDVFITDGLIFAIDYMDQVALNGASYGDEHWPEMKFVGLFPELGDKLHFRKDADRDLFNRCLKEARVAGKVKAAMQPYIEPYRMIVGDSVPEN